jgi:hypothetical protein
MKKIAIIGAAIALVLSSSASANPNYSASEQVWEAQRTNNVKTCGIGFANGSTQIGRILAAGESASQDGAVRFAFKTNANQISWKISEAKITDNANRFTFSNDLLNTSTSTSSLFSSVNGAGFTEQAWNVARNEQRLSTQSGTIDLQPKINVNAEDFPLGTTKVQGKIIVTCSD